MRTVILTVSAFVVLGGCSMGDLQHYSTYDLDRDGVMDARCPGTEYDLEADRWYSWRNPASDQCAEDSPLPEEEVNAHIPPEPAYSSGQES
ncbi:MAG: hypothetical protein AAGI11_21040 [Pseudomonadota bacterium]